MNGRVYDYNVGRFLSVDPFVHDGSQGINPYSYIMNNPLAGTDPTGYRPKSLCGEKQEGCTVVTDKKEIAKILNSLKDNSDNGNKSKKQETDPEEDSTSIGSQSSIGESAGGFVDPKFVAGAASAKFVADTILSAKAATTSTNVPVYKLALASFTLGLITSDMVFNGEAEPQALESFSPENFANGLKTELSRTDGNNGLFLFRIGGGKASNLKIKNSEKGLSPPGISLFIGRNAQEVSLLFKTTILAQIASGAISQGRGLDLISQSSIVGQSTLKGIMSSGFSVMPNPTAKFPNHARLVHPIGSEGFNLENRQTLSKQFVDVVVN
jgi:hypothetical protein